MNLFCWNCRDTARKGFVVMMKDIIKEYDISFVCLLETHCAGDKAERILRCLGLGNQYIQDARGHFGGIWCTWDPSKWMVTILRSSDQCVHMQVQWYSTPPWLLTIVYVST